MNDNDLNLVVNQIKNSLKQIIEFYNIEINKYNKCLCPFHADQNPSLSITDSKGLFNCFVCHAGGDAIEFIQKKESCSFHQAIKKGCTILGIEYPEEKGFKKSVPRKRVYEVLEMVTKFYQEKLYSPEGKGALNSLYKRLIKDSSIDDYRIGFAPNDLYSLKKWAYKNKINVWELKAAGLLSIKKDEAGNEINLVKESCDRFRNRVMFPIINIDGKVTGFSGRALGNNVTAKYLNSEDSIVFSKGKELFGLYQLEKNNVQPKVILTEGQIDVISLVQSGYKAVCPLGTALTGSQAKLILGQGIDEVSIMFDGDKAGQKAIDSAYKILIKELIEIAVIKVSGDLDPNEILIQGGSKLLRKYIKEEQAFVNYKMSNIYFMNEGKEKEKAIEELIELMAVNPNYLMHSVNINHIAKHLALDEKNLLRTLTEKREKLNYGFESAVKNLLLALKKEPYIDDNNLKYLVERVENFYNKH